MDYDTLRFLLEKDISVPLAQEGHEMFEERIPVRFEFILDARVERGLGLGVDDFVRRKVVAHQVFMLFCGTSLRETSSQAYRTCLSKIAALNTEVSERDNGVDITIPVYVNFHTGFAQVSEFFECMRAEAGIEEQWRGTVNNPWLPGTSGARSRYRGVPGYGCY